MLGSSLDIFQVNQLSRENVIFWGQGFNGQVPFGSTGTVDYLITDDCYLTGGSLNVKGGTFGDGADMQVVDKTGKYASAGTVLAQFQTNCQIIETSQKQAQFDVPYVAKILGGLYVRIVYRSISLGIGSVLVAANLDLHKCKV